MNSCQPMSPSSKKAKKESKSTLQQKAFLELKILQAANGGKRVHGSMTAIVNKYKKLNYTDVTYRNLRYRLTLEKSGKTPLFDKPVTQVSENSSVNLSSITFDPSHNLAPVDVSICAADTATEPLAVVIPNVGGRPKGTTKKAMRESRLAFKVALTEVTKEYHALKMKQSQMNKIVRKGTFHVISKKVEEKYKIESGLIKFKTVMNRIDINNLD
jgi:hypothetical protein